MTSATGNKTAVSQRGFTLIEILMVLALIAIAGAMVVANFSAFADRGEGLNPEETLSAAIREARFVAAAERIVTELRFDKELGQLVINGDGIEPITFELDPSFAKDGGANIQLYLIPSSEGIAPSRNSSDRSLETDVIRFSPDRSASPYFVEIDYGSGTPERITFDPFSSLRRAPSE